MAYSLLQFKRKRLLQTFSWLLLFISISGCSVIEKHINLTMDSPIGNWAQTKNKNFKRKLTWKSVHYPWSSYVYHNCDSNAAIGFYFSKCPKVLFIGPPLLPVFHRTGNRQYYQYEELQVRLVLHGKPTCPTDSLLKCVHFFFNDSIEPLNPAQVIPCETRPSYTRENDYFCVDVANGNPYVVDLIFKREPDSIKKIAIRFDQRFNTYLNADFSDLVLDKKDQTKYYPIGYVP
ncbi:MAG: hypothetical protein GC178_04685 [Flavobacteriales bacterium]|nr:hypothetical protein [Flavobacteriales bacterium]